MEKIQAIVNLMLVISLCIYQYKVCKNEESKTEKAKVFLLALIAVMLI